MRKATATNNTLTMLDAIAPNRQRFSIVKTEAPAKTKAQLFAELVANMAPAPLPLPLLPRSPYINARGQMTDGAAHARWTTEQRNGQHQAPAQPCADLLPSVSLSIGHRFCRRCGHAEAAHNVGGR